jgi:hypothetical protein
MAAAGKPTNAKNSAWEKEALSARGFRRVGGHSEYAV